MASSEKAGALKNAFVNAIADELGGEAMAQAGAMENAKLAGKLGLDVGDTASIIYDPSAGKVHRYNNGDNRVSIYDQQGNVNEVVERGGAETMYPLTNGVPGRFGEVESSDLSSNQRNILFQELNKFR